MNPEKVVKGRLTERKHMNHHYVYDWIDEADIPKSTKIETSRWCDDLKPRDGDETNVRSRVVVQQYNVLNRDDLHQGTPPLKVLRMLLALATSKDSQRWGVCGIWDVSVAFFHSPMDECTVGATSNRASSAGLAVGSDQGAPRYSDGQQEVLIDAPFESVSIVPNTYHHPPLLL